MFLFIFKKNQMSQIVLTANIETSSHFLFRIRSLKIICRKYKVYKKIITCCHTEFFLELYECICTIFLVKLTLSMLASSNTKFCFHSLHQLDVIGSSLTAPTMVRSATRKIQQLIMSKQDDA